MQIAAVLFPQVTALDIIGPYEVLQRLPQTTVTFVGHAKGEVRTDYGLLGLTVDATFDEVMHPDVVIVPGGPGTRSLAADQSVLAWLRTVHRSTRFTTSVCTGSIVLAAAGLLDGISATSHWAELFELTKLGVTAVSDKRVVEHLEHRIITAAGVSAGIDMALRLAELLIDTDAAKAMQLIVEYDPQPPFQSGSVANASQQVVERVTEYAQAKS